MKGILEKYRSLVELPAHAVELTLGEGDTPLISLPRIAKRNGAAAVYIKYEGLNPTGSFKDRGMVAAVSEASGRGATSVICASTGNTSAAAAAYAARAGMNAIVLIPQGKVARGKLAASVAYGARVIQIEGSFDDALSLVRTISNELPIALVNSVNPYRLEGQKTAAFEICDELGRAPDVLCIPVGNAGNISAYYMGFRQYDALRGTGMPRMIGIQAEGAAPLVLGHDVENPETIATAIRIGKPARGPQALEATAKTGGNIRCVNDTAILGARDMLAREGIWVEPASAASLAGLLTLTPADCAGKTIVCVCTGHGLKDPDSIPIADIETVPAEMEILRTLLA